MLVLVYVTIVVVIVYVLSTFIKYDSKDSINKNANLGQTPEEMPMPVYRPFKDGPFQMTMGLQSLDLHQWIQIDRNYREQIRLKQKLFNSHRRADLFFCKEETDASAMETLRMLIEHLPAQYPNMFEGNHSKTRITNLITQQTFDLTDSNHLHPLEIAALLVQEDLVIMQQKPNDETYYANVRFFLCILISEIF